MGRIVEIEMGPHFLTLYGDDRKWTIGIAREVYNKYIRKYPQNADIQQKNFTHEANDPNVYHPYGQPNELGREHYTHFHIRFDREPTEDDVDEIIDFLDNIGIPMKSPVLITRLEDLNPLHAEYPQRRDGEDYLSYIERLRKGS